MKTLLSLPPNLVHCFHEQEEVDASEWFCTSDPVGAKLGSGGGTTWLLQACYENYASKESFGICPFRENSYADPCFQLGAWTEVRAESTLFAIAAL